MKKESRFYAPAGSEEALQLRAYEENGQRYLKGYAAVFDIKSRLLYEGGKLFYEYIREGAFTQVLADPELNVVATHNHNRDEILGRNISNTLTLAQKDKGLFFRVAVPNTTLGNDTYEMVQRGDYYECSFVFTVDEEGQRWTKNDQGEIIREITQVSGLYDVAICAVNGAYPNTQVDTELAARMFKELEGGEGVDMTVSIYSNGNSTDVMLNSWESFTTTDFKAGDTITIKSSSGTVVGVLNDDPEPGDGRNLSDKLEIDKMRLRILQLKQNN